VTAVCSGCVLRSLGQTGAGRPFLDLALHKVSKIFGCRVDWRDDHRAKPFERLSHIRAPHGLEEETMVVQRARAR
jgi:hypothetical protein